MKQAWKRAGRQVVRSWRTLLLFEIVFRVYSTLFVFPLGRILYNACMKLTGINCLAEDTLRWFFTNPVMILCLLVIMLIFTLNLMLELSCLFTILHYNGTDHPLSITQILGSGLYHTWRLFRVRNWPMLGFLLYIIPIAQFSTSRSIVKVAHITHNALIHYLFASPYCYFVIAYAISFLILFYYSVCALQVYVLEECPTRTAFSRSFRLTRKKRGMSILSVVLSVVAIILLGNLVLSFTKSLILRILALMIRNETFKNNIMLAVSTVTSFLVSAMPMICGMAMMNVVYEKCMARDGAGFRQRKLIPVPNAREHNAIAFYLVAIVSLLTLLLYDTVLHPLMIRYNMVEYIVPDYTYVISHRGNTDGMVENTLPALQSAVEMGADYIEMDVQSTSDGVVILNHDKTFLRVYGDKRGAWEMTYEDVLKLTAKSADISPVSLYDVLTQCPQQANFLIELKDNRHNSGLVWQVYDLLEKTDCLKRTIIQSSSYSMLREFKKLAPDVPCGYILSFSLGNYEKLKYADFFNIQMDFINSDVVNAVHKEGKKLFCWTVNVEKNMRSMIELGVDGVVTDNLSVLRALVTQGEEDMITDPIEEIIEDTIIGEEFPIAENTPEPLEETLA